MSGVKWPHQTSPRDLESIVSREVQLWEMRQEHPVDASSEKATKGTNAGQAGGAALGGKKSPDRHPWLHYWGDVIVAELTRLGQTDEHAEAFLNDGMNEKPTAEPGSERRPFKWRDRPAAARTGPKRIANKT
jgi:hypothetical protein